MTLLAVDKLEVVYHRAVKAVQGITLKAEGGQIVALLGPNGAGKTTTLRAISGFLGLDDARVSEGTISFKGERIENRLPYENTRRGIVLVPERDKVFPNLTVAENLAAPVPRGTSHAERRRREALVYQFFPQLGGLKTRLGGLLSRGERQILSLARALAFLPGLWLFAAYVNAGLAALLGLTFVVGRALYFRGYVQDPGKRGPGFLIGYVATSLLVAGGLIGALVAAL